MRAVMAMAVLGLAGCAAGAPDEGRGGLRFEAPVLVFEGFEGFEPAGAAAPVVAPLPPVRF